VHVTVRVVRRVWNLRSRRCFREISACFAAALGRFGLRLIEFTVQGNHFHLIVEADSSEALSRGMQGLSVRIAKALNRLMGTRGRVFEDHYHSRILRTPTELVNAIAYVLGNNAHHHGGSAAPDVFSSATCDRDGLVATPISWLLRVGWRRARCQLPEWMRPRAQAEYRASASSTIWPISSTYPRPANAAAMASSASGASQGLGFASIT
jgi:REP element-mobilizing transposase RayT